MKIVFICACLEPGKDGVGDYTTKLAQSCHQNGEHVIIIAINDGFVLKKTEEAEPFLKVRLPKSLKWNEKAKLTKVILDQIEPDWISLQFVPYSFNTKGFVFGIVKPLKMLTKKAKLQIMFHELWIGEELGSEIKRKLIGEVQRFGILNLIRKLKPAIVHTSIGLNKTILAYYGVNSGVLPLFGNIAINLTPSFNWLESEISKQTGSIITSQNRNEFLIVGIFGKIYPNIALDAIFSALLQLINNGKKIIVASIGQLGSAIALFEAYEEKFAIIDFVVLGSRQEQEISSWLQYIDCGIATTPFILLGKSGSFIAMQEHGVPVYCLNPNFSFKFAIDQEYDYSRLQIISDCMALNGLPSKTEIRPRLQDTTKLFLYSIHNYLKNK